jgi:hypothetical protein
LACLPAFSQQQIIRQGQDKDSALIQVHTGDKYYDSGGPGGSRLPDQPGNYKNCNDPFNESTNCTSKYTLCAQGDTVAVNFVDFLIVTGDRMRVFSGKQVQGPTLYNSQNQGVSIVGMRLTTGTLLKSKSADGCITFEWFCTTIGNSIGWDADIIVIKKDISASSCKPVCRDAVMITMPVDTCFTSLTPGQFIQRASDECNFVLKLFYPVNSDQLDRGAVNYTHVGKTFLYQVLDSASSLSCSGYITLKESSAAVSICKNDTLDCDTWTQSIAGLKKAITCSGTNFKILNIAFLPFDCESPFVGRAIRQVERKDTSGVVTVCTDTFYIQKMRFDSLICPTDIHLSCSVLSSGLLAKELIPSYLKFHFDLNQDNIIDGSGESIYPLLNHHLLTDSINTLCKTSVDFNDVIIPGCGLAVKIRRQWTIHNTCSGSDSICIQYIIVEDQNAPVLPPIQSLNYQVKNGECKIEISLQEYQGIKDCSPVAQRVEMSYPDPSAPGKTIVLNNLLPLKITLPPGGYSLKYTFSDQCFNAARRDVCMFINESSPPLIKPIAPISGYLKSNECKGSFLAKSLDTIASGACCNQLHLAVASSDSVKYYKDKWTNWIKNQCLQADSFNAHAAFYNQWIDDWISCYVFKDSIDMPLCQDQKMILRVYKSCNLPPRDPAFSCSEHAWYCYHTIPAFRSWYNTKMLKEAGCISTFPIPCFTSVQNSNNPLDLNFRFASDANLNDTISCANIYAKNNLESFSGQYTQSEFIGRLSDTSTPLIPPLPELTVYADGSDDDAKAVSLCCVQNSCKGETFKLGTWPGTIKAYPDSGKLVGYYSGPIDNTAVFDSNNYYAYPACVEYDTVHFIRPVYCREALIKAAMAPGIIRYDSIFYKPVFNASPKSKEFNIISACTLVWKATSFDSTLRDTCGQSIVIRYWKLTNNCGKFISVNQKLVVKKRSDFKVIFPGDITLQCNRVSDTTNLNMLIGLPVITATEKDHMKVDFRDSILPGIGCKTLFRIWTVKDLCQYDGASNHIKPDIIVNDTVVADRAMRYCTYRYLLDNGDGIMVYKQKIQFIDNQAPSVILGDTVIETLQNCLAGFFQLHPAISDDCTPYQLVNKKCTIDVGSNGSIDQAFGFDSIITVQEGLPIGVHRLKILVTDLCGNKDSSFSSLAIKDKAVPRAFCLTGLNVVTIPSSGIVEIHATDFDAGSMSGCSDNSGGPLRFGFSESTLDTVRRLTCDSLGIKDFQIWVTNRSDKQSSCSVRLQINPASDACITGIDFKVEGYIKTNQQTGISGISVKTNLFNNTGMTNAAGFYSLSNLSKGKSITIRPEKTDDPLNGVSTIDLLLIEKHIKGQSLITDPYLLIAADVNRSGSITTSDLIELRKLILGVISVYSNAKSWMFVPKSFQFPDPANPWTFPETLEYNPLNTTVTDADFVGIKMGDVNNSAVLGMQRLEERASAQNNVFYFKSALEGQSVFYQLFVKRELEITGLQMELILPDGFKLQPQIDDQIKLAPFMMNDLINGNFRMSWTASDPCILNRDNPILTFKSTSVLRSDIYFSSGGLASFYCNAILDPNFLSGIIPVLSDNLSLHIFPNPSSDFVIADFYVNDPHAYKALLVTPGNVILPIEHDFQNGHNRIILSKQYLVSPGAYQLVILNGKQVNSIKFFTL